jgi:subfamily B ATP-binding cassette protein MsbA
MIALLTPLLAYVRPHKRLLAAALACGMVTGLSSGLGIPVIFEWVFRRVFESPAGTYSTPQVVAIALAVPCVFVLRGLFSYLHTYGMCRCGLLTLRQLRQALFDRLQSVSIGFLHQHALGDLASRVQNDTALIQHTLLEIITEAIRQPIQVAGATVALVYLSLKNHNLLFLALFAAAVPICLLPLVLIRQRVRQRGRVAQEAQGLLTQRVHENLSGALDIRAYQLENLQKNQFTQDLAHYNGAELSLARYQKAQQPLMEVIGAGIVGCIFIYAYRAQIPFSVFSAMGLALFFALDALKRFANTISNAYKAQGAMERIQYLVKAPIAITDAAASAAPLPQPVAGAIRFEQVCFAYTPEHPVLRHIDLSIAPKTHVALVGPSGGGKTTLAQLLLRFYDVTHGSVLIDGRDLRSLRLDELRRHVALVPQHPLLFNASVLENIQLGQPQASPEAVMQAAQRALAHDFITQLPQGYHTIIGDRGGRLSGGQRQRIALARAFLKNAPILILDEATSALDAQSEHAIQQALQQLAGTCTLISIAHRLSTIQQADSIVLIEDGAIVAQGTHQDLLGREPRYHALVQRQQLQSATA